MEAATIIQARKELQAPKIVRKVFLICGILSPLLYVGADILAGILYAGYSFTSQAISELFAIGAPTSGLIVLLFTVSSVLLVAFVLSVWMSAGWNRALRAMALMMVGNAVNGLVLWNIVFSYASKVGADLSTLWLAERISTYVYDLWQVVLPIVLLREEKRPGAIR
ncbi:MAG: DUF998 domain-containing protein [Candidatus Methanoperedens sp.]|nr:DUF998 domain-containing protein [Candidatus Methanoperedens sp.]